MSQIEIEQSQISPKLRRQDDDGRQMFNSDFKKIVNNRNSTSVNVIGISNQAYVEDFWLSTEDHDFCGSLNDNREMYDNHFLSIRFPMTN